MKISQLAIHRLNNINWFVNLGVATTLPGVIQAQSLSLFIKGLNSDEWESATLEAGYEITGYLAKNTLTNINIGTLWSKKLRKLWRMILSQK
ncbi:hypothetical protein VZ142_05460 [Enterobacter hormaechei]|uniref:hypothetical protein n=1 Tax=Enterobacter hormaechei TaxID=158836 RepID=UPI002E284443|nr:hypothetical protein [Enterobacter hormaechei]MED5637242.1 hypothetical protein [Enterobacter hormaechei]